MKNADIAPRVWGTMLMDMTDKLHLVLRRWCLAFGILCIFFPVRKSGVWRFVRDVYRLGRRPEAEHPPRCRPHPTGHGLGRSGDCIYLTSAFEVFHRYYSSTGFVRCRTRWVDRRRLHNPALTVARLSSVLARLSSDLGVQTQMRSQAAPRHSHESGCESPRLDELAVSRELNPITTRRRRVKRC